MFLFTTVCRESILSLIYILNELQLVHLTPIFCFLKENLQGRNSSWIVWECLYKPTCFLRYELKLKFSYESASTDRGISLSSGTYQDWLLLDLVISA